MNLAWPNLNNSLVVRHHCSGSLWTTSRNEWSVFSGETPGVSQREELQATFVDLAEKYHTLEAFCEQHKSFELPVVSLATAERFDYPVAGRLVHQVRNQLGLGERPGLLCCGCWRKSAMFAYSTWNSSRAEVQPAPSRSGLEPLYCSLKNVRWRWNFDLAHELFHLLTWNVFRHGDGEQPVTPSDREEKLATCFARNLLMPEEVFREAVDAQRDKSGSLGFDGLFKVAREFDVSTEAVVWQIGFVYNIPSEKLQPTVTALREQISFWDVREKDTPPARPLRFEALARQALRKGASRQVSTPSMWALHGGGRCESSSKKPLKMSRLKLLFLDANVVIHLHEFGIWARLIAVCDVHFPGTVVGEADFCEVDDERHYIDLNDDISQDRIHVFDVELSRIKAFRDQFDSLYVGGLMMGRQKPSLFSCAILPSHSSFVR